MKKLFTLTAIFMAIAVSSCSKFDDGAIWEKFEEQEQILNDHEKRIAALEELCRQLNTNIDALQTIVEALEKNDYVLRVSPVREDGEIVGYTISFANSDTITIYNGKDGKDGQDGKDGKDGVDGKDGQNGYTPQIGVMKDTDGIYYWTVDGEWLLDGKGNKIKAVGEDGRDGQDGTNGSNGNDGQDGTDGANGSDGQDGVDGKDGVTPRLKIENDYWYVSYDEGATWIELGKATGEDGADGSDGADSSDGADGDSIFSSVTQDDEYVYFNLADSTTIILPKTNINPNIIQFEDRYVKDICVSNWDTDGDGELSYDEAAVVENIGSLFSRFHVDGGEVIYLGNSNILSFTELKYFTGITTLSNKAFYYDINLSDIILPQTLTEISDGGTTMIDGRFDSTQYLPYGTFAHTKIRSISIPDSVNKIGSYAFYDCSLLKYVSIGSGVATIGDDAFYNCKAELTINSKLVENNYTKKPEWLVDTQFHKIVIGGNISHIGNYAFYDIDSFTSVILPNTITSIGDYSFGKCSSLKNIVILNGVYSIGDYSFSECDNLANIVLPSSLTTIGKNCFYKCTSLSNIELSEGLYSIGDYAFYECVNLTEVNIPNSIVSIGKNSFYGCSNINSITIGKDISTIGASAFSSCSKLKTVYCKATTPPTIEKTTFGYNDSALIIYVPKESVSDYRAATGWSDFASKIVGYNFENNPI